MFRKLFKKVFRLAWKTALWFFIVTFLWVLSYRWVDPPFTILQLREKYGLEDSKWHSGEWKDLDDIPYELHLAVISSEDQNFLDHWGIDYGAVQKAVEYNKTHDKKRGASTISQQTAKNVFLWPNRSWLRKGLEVYFTYLIELLWSKERIMEVYLNVIEMGEGTFGVDAAAKRFWNKRAEDLSRNQCALIAASLPTARKSNPGNPSSYLTKRKNHVLQQMKYLGKSYFQRHGKPGWPLD